MEPLLITILQTSPEWENKRANLADIEQKIESIIQQKQVVILPEMFSTGFSMTPKLLAEDMEGETVSWMRQMASKHKIVLTGSIIIEEGGNYFNRLIWMLPNGQLGYYNKRHLFGYANEHLQYSPGNGRLVAQVKGWKINLQICYDLRFPVWSRQANHVDTAEPEYDILINVANWPESRRDAWATLLKARAIENQCYVVGVNRAGLDGNNISYPGGSMVLHPSGKIMHQLSNASDVLTIAIDKSELTSYRAEYPFLKDGDEFNIFA